MKEQRQRSFSAVIPTIDQLVETRYKNAEELVARIRQLPDVSTPSDIVDHLVNKYSRELGAVAAVTGGAAAVPGAGTIAALMASSADVAFTVGKLGEMVLAIGIAYGHGASSFAERKAWVLTVLSMGRGAVVGVEGIAGRLGAEGGARLVSSLSSAELSKINSKLASKMLAKLATDQSVARFGRLLPFGIGAGIGAAGNVMIVRSVAKAARQFFSDEHPVSGQRPHPGAIDVPSVETLNP